MKLYRDLNKEPHSLFVKDTTLLLDNPLRFRKKL